jgi:CubicO group peptidase (beta-lactamase class C family)
MGNFAKMDKLLNKFALSTIPGCACTIMKNGEIIYEGYTGYADIDAKKPISASSMFRQASTTKLFTYAIIAMLFEEGEILLSDPLYEYLPEWRNSKKTITLPNGQVEFVPTDRPINIRDAVTMACGLPYCMFPAANPEDPTLKAMSKAISGLLEKGTPTLREEVRAMADAPLMFEPGTQWLYGFGSEIVGALVEVITGKPLRVVFRERLIEPLGLKNTETLFKGTMRDQLVGNYRIATDGSFEKLPAAMDKTQDPDLVPIGARPSLMTSSTDMATFMSMLANGGKYKGEQLLGRKTIDLMRTNHLNDAQLKDFTNTYLAGYGYGLGVRTLMSKAAGQHNGSIGAFGWTGGAGSWAEADPSEGIAIAYMHNLMPNRELYHHLRVRSVAYGCLE